MPTLSINCRYLYNVVQTLSVHTLRFCVVQLAHMAAILSVQVVRHSYPGRHVSNLGNERGCILRKLIPSDMWHSGNPESLLHLISISKKGGWQCQGIGSPLCQYN